MGLFLSKQSQYFSVDPIKITHEEVVSVRKKEQSWA